MSRRLLSFWMLMCIVALASACSKGSGENLREGQAAQSVLVGTRELPTIYPTATPYPSPSPANTNTPQPTAVPVTEVAFDQLVVDVTYSIPILGLERRIRGNVAGEIEVIDESNGSSLTLKNRPGVIVEMQQALPRAAIEDMPDNCDACVQVDYVLPLTDESGQGWLKDVQLLASLENYTAAVLGPHFPEGTIAGLRREATPFEVAHSVAITSNGEMWTWTATQSEISEPTAVSGILDQATNDLARIEWDSFPTPVGHICFQGGGREWLQLESPDSPVLIEVRCPELYLPGQLLPIYLTLSQAAADQLEDSELSPPELPMSLDTLVLFRRADGSTLTLSRDGQLGAVDAEGVRYTSTLTTTQTLSLTTLLLDSSLLQPGPSAIFEDDPGNLILVRGIDAVYELAWREAAEVPAALIAAWNQLLDRLIQEAEVPGNETPVEETPTSETPAPEPTSTGTRSP